MEIEIIYQIEEMRLKRKMSKSELSRLTGIAFNNVSGMLNKKRMASPKLQTLAKYAIALDCEVKDLFIEKIIRNEKPK